MKWPVNAPGPGGSSAEIAPLAPDIWGLLGQTDSIYVTQP
jgi:hypothetical protein